MKCSKCGSDNLDGSKFCNTCGNKFEEQIITPIKIEDNTSDQETPKIEIVQEKQNNNTKPTNRNNTIGFGAISIILVIVLILIASIGAFSLLPIFQVSKSYQEAYQEPYQVPYQEAVQKQVNLQYSDSGTWSGSGILNWEVDSTVTITNLDNTGGPFTVYIIVYDEGKPAYTSTSQTQYLSPGQTGKLTFRSSGLSYSTDWDTRYSVKHFTTPPQKTVTSYETKYRTDYRTAYRTNTKTEHVNLIQYILGSNN